MNDATTKAISGRRTVRLCALTAGFLLIALIFGALRAGVVAATFVLLGTAFALATIWSWFDEDRPVGFRALAAVSAAALVVIVVAAVGVARYT